MSGRDGMPWLILACSATKVPGARMMSTYERYDGPAWRTLRASGFPNVYNGPRCRVLALSAQYGLLSAFADLPDYDREMDAARAAEMAAMDDGQLRDTLYAQIVTRERTFSHFWTPEIYVWGGKLYRSVVAAWAERGIFGDTPIEYSSGGIGEQLGQLSRWLRDYGGYGSREEGAA